MKNRIKILISITIIFALAFSFIIPYEAGNISVTDPNIIFGEDCFVATPDQVCSDKKIYCKATVEDDFKDNSVIVVITHKSSLDFNKFELPDFSVVKPKCVTEITASISDEILNAFKNKNKEYITELRGKSLVNDLSIEDNAYNLSKLYIEEKYPHYNKVIEIELNTHDKENVLNTIEILEKFDEVMCAQPSYHVHPCSTYANDYYNNSQWAINNISLPAAWDLTTGSSNVLVGVIDDGIQSNHPDLSGNYNSSLSSAFAGGSPAVSTGGHGTSVAGIVGAVGNNYIGVTGACWNVSLVSLRITNSDGNAYSEDIYNAIVYARQNGIDILNLSWNFELYDVALQSLIASYNGLLICSAGNDNANIDNTSENIYKYPSLYTNNNIISVASITSSNTLASDSNYGKTSVDLAAPGGDVYTTTNGGNYANVSGTSFAAPYVTGVAALIKSKYPSITNLGIRRAILSSVTQISSLSNKVSTGGKLNAYAALNAANNCSYTVQYRANGGTGSMADTTITYGFYTALRNNAFSKQYYNFSGWDACRASDNKHRYKNSSGAEKWYVEGAQPSGYTKALYNNQARIAHTSSVNNDIVTMTAQWNPYKYTIVFMRNANIGGQTMSNKVCQYDRQETLPDNVWSQAGYNFGGWKVYRGETASTRKWLYQNGNTYNWYTENSQPSGYNMAVFANRATFRNLTTVDNDILYFVAQWDPISYTIKYEPNGGAGSMPDTIGYTNQSVQLRNNTFVKQHNRFVGWHMVDSDGYWCTVDGYWDDNVSSDDEKRLFGDGEYISYVAEDAGVEVYAKAQWILLGDVDLDGEITIMDATIIQRYLSRLCSLTDEQLIRADFDEDGTVSIMDVTEIQMYLAGIN